MLSPLFIFVLQAVHWIPIGEQSPKAPPPVLHMLSNFRIEVSALLGCQFLSEAHSCFLMLVYSARSPSTLLCPGNAAGSQVLYDPSIPAGGDIICDLL